MGVAAIGWGKVLPAAFQGVSGDWGSVSCISEDGYQLRAVFVLRAVDVARFAVEEVSRGRRTWSQIYFATGSCVTSLQRTCKAWMQLHMPPKAFACVSKRGSLTRDLNSCSIYKKKNQHSTSHHYIYCWEFSYLFISFSNPLFIPQLVFFALSV